MEWTVTGENLFTFEGWWERSWFRLGVGVGTWLGNRALRGRGRYLCKV